MNAKPLTPSRRINVKNTFSTEKYVEGRNFDPKK
jgi:hypothetical protein